MNRDMGDIKFTTAGEWMQDHMDLVGKVIQLKEPIEDFEAYPETHMRARVVQIEPKYVDDPDPRDHVYVITLDYSEHETYNQQFESTNYYDKNGVPRLNAKQAGFYNQVENIYMPNPNFDSWDKYMEIVQD